jgi:hypothetical protein
VHEDHEELSFVIEPSCSSCSSWFLTFLIDREVLNVVLSKL